MTPCLLCRKDRPGDVYTAIAENGMRLEAITVCPICAAAPHPEYACAVCKQPVGPERPAEVYEGRSGSGKKLGRKAVCYPCAVTLGPEQGLTEPLPEG